MPLPLLPFPRQRGATILLLATDLDGTFLGGRQADRLALYRAIRAASDMRLVFVTGRGVESVIPLLGDALVPDPEFIIADVGATIVATDGLRPVDPIQWEIDSTWVGTEIVLEAIGEIEGLERQPVPQERRVSFHASRVEVIDEVRRRLQDLPVDLLHSADRYLDVLPRGVNKGSTLMRLVEQLRIPGERVLVAGDTINDLSLFETGYHGVVVGQSEAALVNATAGSKRVLRAATPGAGGILEALRAFDARKRFAEAAPSPVTSGDAQLVVVYHRLPFDERMVDNQLTRRRPTSPNGIIPTLLGCFEGGRPGSWVAWSTQHAPGAREVVHELVDEERYPNLLATKLPLSEDDVRRFYKEFSKEAFWPVIFSFVDKARFRADEWEHYVQINQRFAEATAAEADEGAMVWIHDYNLWMVPGHLRRLRPDLRIGFFHHTSFPPADIFNVIPWAGQIVGSLAQCDLVGFHVPRYAANFLDVLRSHVPTEVIETAPCAPRFRVHGVALAIPVMPTLLQVGDRKVRLGAFPVGVNVRAVQQILADPVRRETVEAVRERFRGTRLVLSVERLDYVKGPLQKLEGFERLLELHPEHRGSVSLVFVTTPPAPGMEIYEEVRVAVDQAVGRINGRFATLSWTPIHYLFRSLPFDEVVGFAAAADVAWVTPLRDGLNLVAKEYVAAQAATDGAGVLVVSEFAGAAVELHGALLTNPYDVEGMTATLHQALTLPEEERRQRMRRLTEVVEGHDVDAWSREFLEALAGSPPNA
ncbi:MAG: glucosylglycerol-phosphate synthase [Gemmatimonadales bacterium]|nr:glucosylglycerol-phosphate synthase [Gemmatimonadales bacterium]